MNIQGLGSVNRINQTKAPFKERPAFRIIKKGDTLSSLAREYKMSINDFCKWVGISNDPNKLKIGQKINLPQAKIPDGNGLLALVSSYGMSKETFCNLNGMTSAEFDKYVPQINEKFYVYKDYQKASTTAPSVGTTKTKTTDKTNEVTDSTKTTVASTKISGYTVENLPQDGYFLVKAGDKDYSVRVTSGKPRAIKDKNGYYVSETIKFEPFNPNTGKLKNKVIMVNAGHGILHSKNPGLDPGTGTSDENKKLLQEWRKNRDFADELIKQLRAEGATVIFTNGHAKNACAAKNELSCDMLISLHCNASKNENAQGIWVIYPDNNHNKSKEFAEIVSNKFGENSSLKKDNEGQHSSIGVLRYKTKDKKLVPSILLEMGFMTNSIDIRNIDSWVDRQKKMKIVKDAIVDYYNGSEK